MRAAGPLSRARKGTEIAPDLIADIAEQSELIFGRSMEGGRIFKALVDGDRTREHRAGFFRVIADRQDVVEVLSGEFVDVLGTMAGDIDAKFVHDLNRFGSYSHCGVDASAEDFEAIAGVVAEQSFGHLAAGGVAGAKDEDALFVHALPAVCSAGTTVVASGLKYFFWK